MMTAHVPDVVRLHDDHQIGTLDVALCELPAAMRPCGHPVQRGDRPYRFERPSPHWLTAHGKRASGRHVERHAPRSCKVLEHVPGHHGPGNVTGAHDEHRYLVHGARSVLARRSLTVVEGQPPRLDATDLALLRLLQRDARQTNKDLADAVGIAQSTCLERVRALRAQGVIKGWHADVDLDAIGRPLRAMISVRLRPKTTASVRRFQQEMLDAPEVVSVWTVTGADDFLVEVATYDVAHLRDFVLDHVTGRSEVVDASTSLIYDQVRVWEIPPAAQVMPKGSSPDAPPSPPGTRAGSAP